MIVDKVYQDVIEQKRSSTRRSKALTASIVTSCRRLNWYIIKGVKTSGSRIDPEWLLLGREGNLHHDAVRALIAETPGLTMVDEEFGVVGSGIYARADGLVKLDCEDCDRIDDCWWLETHEPPAGGLHNLEVKTFTAGSFRIFSISGTKAFPRHYSQCQVILSSSPPRPLIVLGKNRENAALSEDLLPPDWELIAKLAELKLEFDKSLQEDIPPESEFGYTSMECQGCDYRFKCWFTKIRQETALEADLDKKEVVRIHAIMAHMRGLDKNFNEYLMLEDALKTYIALLHVRHSVSGIKIPGISSRLIRPHREVPNLEYIKSVLTDEEYVLAFTEEIGAHYRTTIRL